MAWISRLRVGSPGTITGPRAATFEHAGQRIEAQPCLALPGVGAVAGVAAIGEDRPDQLLEEVGVLGAQGRGSVQGSGEAADEVDAAA